MTEFLHAIQSTAFGQWVDSDSIWAFPSILLLHTYGMGILVGVVTAIDLRILGFTPGLPLQPLRRFFPLIWAAFWVNAATGTVLLIGDAESKAVNPDFLLKMVFVALGAITLRRIQRRVIGDGESERPLPDGARMLAAASLVFWLGAIVCGRLLAYITPALAAK